MSKFRTVIPIPVQELLDALPKGAYVHGQTYDKAKQELVVIWEIENVHTGFTFPVDYPMADFVAKRLPKAVKDQKALKTPPKDKNATTSLPDAKKCTCGEPHVSDRIEHRYDGKPCFVKDVPDYHWDKERFSKEQATGAPLEFQGVESNWRPVDAEHVFTEGFFYRKVITQTQKGSGSNSE